MVRSLPKLLTVDEFIIQYGDRDRYELIDGELTEMEPTGPHKQVSAFLGRKLNVEIDRQDILYFIPHRCLIKLLGTETAFRPDVIVLDRTQLMFQNNARLVSSIFPDLQLTAQQIFAAGISATM